MRRHRNGQSSFSETTSSNAGQTIVTEHLQTIEYTLFDPTGNITLLAETSVPTESQPSVAAELMALEPGTEQVGFVTFDADRVFLRMAGGEFCGNAAMSAAALFLERAGRTEGTVAVQVSGAEDAVAVVLSALPDGSRRGTVAMPRPDGVGKLTLSNDRMLPAVFFPGITHLILEEKMEPADAETLAKALCAQLNAEALGLMFLNREEESLIPLVYVPGAGTLFWETACASGTTAVGAWLATESGLPVHLNLKQPGGSLEIAAEPGGELQLTGTVRIIHRAETVVSVR